MTTPFPPRLVKDFLDIRMKIRPLTPDLLAEFPARLPEYERLLRRLLRHTRTIATDHTGEEAVGAYDQTWQLIGDLLEQLHPYTGGRDEHGQELTRLWNTYLDPARDVMRAAIVRKHNGPAFAEMERRNVPPGALDIVLAQAAYMSGDMFGVSAALTLNPGMGLVLLYDPAANTDRDVRAHLLKFYDGPSEKPHPRVALVPTTDCEAAYRLAQDGYFPPGVFPLGRPSILAGTQRCVAIGRGTSAVAARFGEGAAAAKARLEAEWLPPGWKTGQVSGTEGGKTIATWVTEKFGKADAAYCFIWFRRSGAKGGAHKELDTSIVATRELIKVVRQGELIRNAKVVIIGDSGHGLGKDLVDIDLTEFWKEPGSPFEGGDRRTQLAFFAYLLEKRVNFMNVGMRSGALEGPALLGARTVYLEEKYNLQEGRMEQWQGAVPGYSRIELGHVPTASGKRVLVSMLNANLDRGDQELDGAIEDLSNLINLSAQILREIIVRCAGRGVIPAKHVFDPLPVEQCFTLVCQEIQDGLGGKNLKDVLGKSWSGYRYITFAALRSAQSWGKAQVKLQMCKDYAGPEEGLSKQDQERLWSVMAQTIDVWQVQRKSK